MAKTNVQTALRSPPTFNDLKMINYTLGKSNILVKRTHGKSKMLIIMQVVYIKVHKYVGLGLGYKVIKT